MRIEEFKIKAFDRINLYVKCWLPQDPPDGVIILVHGLGEHINRYNQWALHFSNHGWAVTGIDLRGHGLSDGKRGAASYQTYLNDIDSVFRLVHKKFSDLPIVLYGHSLGGNLALGYEISRKPDISRLIITSPWLKLTRPPAKSLLFFSRFIVKLFPGMSISTRLNPSYFSREKKIIEEYDSDPLVHDKISISSFLQVQEWASVILKNKHKINVPLLLLHGADDQITSWRGSHIFARETSESTHYKLWESCYHELHNESCKEDVFRYISHWLSNVKNVKLKSNVC
jgi:alpha-beta hydrolase superfamily lysophospholipase